MSLEKNFSHASISSFLKEQKIKTLTDIQTLVIPDLLKGKSVNVIAKTGSGKTLCFALPIFDLLKTHEENLLQNKLETPRGAPMAVVLAPTRELAMQLHKVFKSIAHHSKMRVRILAGGEGPKVNHLLARDMIDILIATPGRLSSALKRKELNLKTVKYLVMDEADQLLEMGFRKDLVNIYESCDASLVHVGLFSATHSAALEEFCTTKLADIDFASYNSQDKNKLTQSVRTFNIFLNEPEKLKMVTAFIKNEAKGRGIIFVNKHETVEFLKHELDAAYPKIKFHALHGEMEAQARKKNYDQFLKENGILISTDITARGMDIPDLVWILNYDLPFEAVYYIHRCGRVGRQKKEGFAYNLVTPKDLNIVSRINEAIRNQTAIKLTVFDEKKFSPIKKAQELKGKVTKLDVKKKQLADLKAKVSNKEKPGARRKVKTIKKTTTPRYKRK
jgi:superfamily II DNA/RNA helicase